MKYTNDKILILGTWSFAEEIADVISEIPGVSVSGFVENLDRKRCNQSIFELPVFWVEEIRDMAKTHKVICGLGTTHRDRYVAQVAEYKMTFVSLAHPSARISKKSSLGEGTFISCNVVVAANTHIDKHVVINRGSLIGHHTNINPFVTIGPGANIGGNSQIGNNTYIGIGASVIDHISIGSQSVVAAGAVVTKDVPDNVLVAGTPAQIIKEGINGM